MTTNEKPSYDTVKERAKTKLERDFGPKLLALFNDKKTVEMMLNEDGKVWIDTLGEGMSCVGELRPAQGEAIIKTIAGYHKKEVNEENPNIESYFPLDNSRFAGQLPPLVDAPVFAIRKRAISIFTLNEYVDNGIMTLHQKEIIVDAIKKYKNMLIIGGTGTGKTTLVNAVINEIVVNNKNERPIIIEDTPEIQCAADNHVKYKTTPNKGMKELIKISLRMRPDRIFVGEVRGAEALDLLGVWNSGHEGGAATLHANNVDEGLEKLDFYISENGDKTPKNTQKLIGNVVHLIIHIGKENKGTDKETKKILGILEVLGFEDGKYLKKKL